MMRTTFVFILFGSVFCGQEKAEHRQRETAEPYHDDDYYDNYDNHRDPNYSYSYAVKDDDSLNLHGHKQTRDGDVVRGQYLVLLPDGNKQVVQYEAGKFGYRAKVKNNHGSHEKLSKEYQQKYVDPYQDHPTIHPESKRVGTATKSRLHQYEHLTPTQPPIVSSTRRILINRYQDNPLISESQYQKGTLKTDISAAALEQLKEAAMAESEIIQPHYQTPVEGVPGNYFIDPTQKQASFPYNTFPQEGPAFPYQQVPFYTTRNLQPIQQLSAYPFYTKVLSGTNGVLQLQRPYFTNNEIGSFSSPYQQIHLNDQDEQQSHTQVIAAKNSIFQEPFFQQPIYTVSGTVHNSYFQPRFVSSSIPNNYLLNYEDRYGNYIGKGHTVRKHPGYKTVTATPAPVRTKPKFHTNLPASRQRLVSLYPFANQDNVHEGPDLISTALPRQFPAYLEFGPRFDRRFVTSVSPRNPFLLASPDSGTPKIIPRFGSSESPSRAYFPQKVQSHLSIEKPSYIKAIQPPLVIETPKTYSPPAFKSKN